MKTTKKVLFIALFGICFNTGFSQTEEQLKKQKLAEKELKLKEAKQRAAQEVFVFGYHGGTMAPFGASFYMMNGEDKPGFYASIRGGKEKFEANVPFKGLNLNVGVTKNLFFPVGIYAAVGISDYDRKTLKPVISPYAPNERYDSHWEFGLDTSIGLIFHIKGLELQTGISLFNFSRPEFCFGLGFNLIRT